jgi:hypothetical protein
MKKTISEQVRTGLRMGFGFVAGMFTITLLVYGFIKLRHPETDDTLVYFLKGYPPLVVGTISLALGVGIIWVTMPRWAKFLPGLFAYAVFGALLAVAGGGFPSRIPSLQLTRLEAGVMASLYAACSLMTYRLGSHELNLADRLTILAAPLLLIWAGDSTQHAAGFEALAAMVGLFGLAWAYSHFWVNRPKKRRLRAPKTVTDPPQTSA